MLLWRKFETQMSHYIFFHLQFVKQNVQLLKLPPNFSMSKISNRIAYRKFLPNHRAKKRMLLLQFQRLSNRTLRLELD